MHYRRSAALAVFLRIGGYGSSVVKCPPEGQSTGIAEFDLYHRDFNGDLRSALSGGQWPQTRLAAIKGFTDDNLCQLCHEQPGTLAHRLRCPCIKPPGGWQPPPTCSLKVSSKIGTQRLELLSTRGFLVPKVSCEVVHRRLLVR